MNNRVVFAAAGHGKTYNICREAIANLADIVNKRILLLTYTNEGAKSLEDEFKKQNFGVLSHRVEIRTWYSFLLSELIKPYQRNLKLKIKHFKNNLDFIVPENYIKSIAFYETGEKDRFYNSSHVQYYLNSHGDIHKDDVSGLAYICNQHSEEKVIRRLESMYSHIYIDELQDYAGWDLELFRLLFASSIQIMCVGDYKQATFRTNSSTKNRQYRDDKIKNFFIALEKKQQCTVTFENTTRRFGIGICAYVNSFFQKDVESSIVPNDALKDNAENAGVFIIDNKYLKDYCDFYKPVILRYNKESKIHFKCSSRLINYGASKGATFERAIIIPTATVLPFINEGKAIKAQTKAKFYVACTRAKYSVVFAMSNPKAPNLFKPYVIKMGEKEIPAFRYSVE